jgi:putative oxidoreductase
MNILLWVLQALPALYIGLTGIMHFVVRPGLPAPMAWMYELPASLHVLSGTAEILRALGLILPSLTRIVPHLTPLAAMGLVIVMTGALVWHLGRGEAATIVMNVTLALLAAFVAFGRWRLKPLAARRPA